MKKIKVTGTKAFTLVELLVVITILVILGTIAFIALQGYSKNSRDSVRVSDISKMKSTLELYSIDLGTYPEPTELQPVTYSGGLAWNQGIFGESTFTNVKRLDKIPKDPLTEKEYVYSLLNTKKEYEIGGIMEGDEISYQPHPNINAQAQAGEKIAKALIMGTYNGVSLRVNTNNTSYVLAIPSIITSIDLEEETNRKLEEIIPNKEIVLNGYKNLPSNYVNTIYKTNPEKENEEYEIVKDNDITNVLIYEGDLESLTTEYLITKIIEVYSGTTIEKIGKAEQFLEVDVTDEDELEKADIIGVHFINNELGGSAETKIYATCNGIAHNTIKGFYTTNELPFPTSCNTVKQDFVCKDGVWKNGEEILDKNIYPYESCTELGALNCEANASYNSGTTQTYNVTALNHNDTETFTTDINENNGVFRYSIDVNCYNGVLTNTTETGPTNVSCNLNYTWNSGTEICEADTRTFTCDSKPTTGTVWNSVSSYEQTWNGTVWMPTDSTTSYNLTSSTTECRYKCADGYYWDGDSCETQWSGNASTGFIFKNTSGVTQYPTSCSDLLNQNTWKNTLIGSPWNGSKFVDGVYFIDPDGEGGETEFKVYCDMTTDGGGWTLIGKSRDILGESLYNNSSLGNITSIELDSTAKLSDSNIISIISNSSEKIIYAYNLDIDNYYVYIKLGNNNWNSTGIMTDMRYSDNINGPWSKKYVTYHGLGQSNGGPSSVTMTTCVENGTDFSNNNVRLLLNGSCEEGHGGPHSFNWAHNSYNPPTLAGSEIMQTNLYSKNSLWFIR